VGERILEGPEVEIESGRIPDLGGNKIRKLLLSYSRTTIGYPMGRGIRTVKGTDR
jgi:hypothetical protein